MDIVDTKNAVSKIGSRVSHLDSLHRQQKAIEDFEQRLTTSVVWKDQLAIVWGKHRI